MPPLAQNVCQFDVAVHGRRDIYVSGGRDNSFKLSTKVFCFNIKSRSWTEAPQLNQGRFWHASLILADKMYVVGGRTGYETLTGTIEVLTLGTSSVWINVPVSDESCVLRSSPAVAVISHN